MKASVLLPLAACFVLAAAAPAAEPVVSDDAEYFKRLSDAFAAKNGRIAELEETVRRKDLEIARLESELAAAKGTGADPASADPAEPPAEKPGVLEFKLVHPRADALVRELLAAGRTPDGFALSGGKDGYVQDPAAKAAGRPLPDPDTYRDFGTPPEGFVLALERDGRNPGLYRPVFVESLSRLGNADVRRVSVAEDPLERVALDVSFTEEGTKKFSQLTAKCVDRRLAICVDGIVLSTPVIREAVTGGHAWISGSFTRKEAEELAKRLSPEDSASSLDGVLDLFR